MKTFSVLFVCTDNLSRSALAEEVLRQRALQAGLRGQLVVASAATHDLNTGEPIDYHVQKHALRRGYDLSAMRVRLLQDTDLERFDWILAMQASNLEFLQARATVLQRNKLAAFTPYCSSPAGVDVPDPFYATPTDIERVIDIIEDGCEGILAKLLQQT